MNYIRKTSLRAVCRSLNKKTRERRSTRCKCRFERLDQRQMLAGDIVQFSQDFLIYDTGLDVETGFQVIVGEDFGQDANGVAKVLEKDADGVMREAVVGSVPGTTGKLSVDAISDDGLRLVGHALAGDVTQAVTWVRSGVGQPFQGSLVSLPGDSIVPSEAWSGGIVGTLVEGLTAKVFRWHADGAIDRISVPGVEFGEVHDISADGRIIVGNCGGNACLVQGNQLLYLDDTLPGAGETGSAAFGISPDGDQIVGHIYPLNQGVESALVAVWDAPDWDLTIMQSSQGGQMNGVASDVTESGYVVGGEVTASGNVGFIWHESFGEKAEPFQTWWADKVPCADQPFDTRYVDYVSENTVGNVLEFVASDLGNECGAISVPLIGGVQGCGANPISRSDKTDGQVGEGQSAEIVIDVVPSAQSRSVDLQSDDQSFVMPSQATIPANSDEISFTVTAADDLQLSGDRESAISVTLGGFEPLLINLSVIDDEAQAPYRNPAEAADVDGVDGVRPLDALKVVNFLANAGVPSIELSWDGSTAPTEFVDANGDGFATPSDALFVVNVIFNANLDGTGEGENAATLIGPAFSDDEDSAFTDAVDAIWSGSGLF